MLCVILRFYLELEKSFRDCTEQRPSPGEPTGEASITSKYIDIVVIVF